MSSAVFLAVLAAALLHAVWNAMIKGARDPAVSMAAVVIGVAPLALVCIALTPAPHSQAWPFMAASLAFHIGYELFLLRAYGYGDFTLVYPVARGAAPLLTALAGGLWFGDGLTAAEWVGVAAIGAGLLGMGLSGLGLSGMRLSGTGLTAGRSGAVFDRRALTAALITGGCIAGYSVSDGQGARAAGSSLAYFGWEALLNAALFAPIMALRRRDILARMFSEGRGALLLGANASFVAYALVTWAFTQAPVALVAALRETSILFAMVIGVMFLGEWPGRARLAFALVIMAGVVLTRLSALS